MPQRREPKIIRFELKSGLEVSGFDELDNKQMHTIRRASGETIDNGDGTTRTVWNATTLPYMIVVQWMSHGESNWNLTDARGKLINNKLPANVERLMPPEDFDELTEHLFDQFGWRVMGVPEDLVEELKAERDAALSEDRPMEVDAAPDRIARAAGSVGDDEDESAEGNPTLSRGKTTKTHLKSA